MQTVTVGTKYQVVIPKKVREKLKIKPGDKISIGAKNKESATLKTNATSWAERTRGIAKKAWKNIDTTKYLEDLRNEWEKKV